MIDVPSEALQQSRHAAIAVATELSSQADDVLGEIALVVPDSWLVTVRRTMLAQDPASSPEASRACGLTAAALSDSFAPDEGKALFYLVTVQTASGESDLGFNSDGLPRLHSNPCP